MSKNETGRESPRTKLRRVLRFMKKTLKKFAAVGLSLTSVMGLVACGSNSGKQDATKATVDWANVQKPEQFTVMVDGTVVKETNGAQEFYKYLGDLTGLDIKWIRPEHSSYYDSVKNAFASGDIPDVVLLSSDFLANFAANGYLWDMTDAWNQSATKNSGRLVDQAEIIESGNMVAGPDGEKALYGFSPARGNGCCTYIKSSALTAAGYKPEEVASKTLTYDEYYKMLKDMKAASANQNFVISCSGFIAGGDKGTPEAPYTNYLPEFYQNANFTFYYDEAAKEYKDGFAQQDMKDALARLKTAVDDGILDKASQNQTTSDARNKWNARMLQQLLQYSHTGQVHGLIHFRTLWLIRQIRLSLLSLLRSLVHIRSVLLLLGVLHTRHMRMVRLKESSSTSSILCLMVEISRLHGSMVLRELTGMIRLRQLQFTTQRVRLMRRRLRHMKKVYSTSFQLQRIIQSLCLRTTLIRA